MAQPSAPEKTTKGKARVRGQPNRTRFHRRTVIISSFNPTLSQIKDDVESKNRMSYIGNIWKQTKPRGEATFHRSSKKYNDHVTAEMETSIGTLAQCDRRECRIHWQGGPPKKAVKSSKKKKDADVPAPASPPVAPVPVSVPAQLHQHRFRHLSSPHCWAPVAPAPVAPAPVAPVAVELPVKEAAPRGRKKATPK